MKSKKIAITFYIVLLFLLEFSSHLAYAQEIHGKPNVWLTLMGKIRLSKKIEVGSEFHLRRDNWLKEQEQLLLRPFFNYTHKRLTLTAGYTYVKTSPYGGHPLPIDGIENNFWEQATMNQSMGEFKLVHRYRLEHRFNRNIVFQPNGVYELLGHTYSNRFRYRLMIKKSLNNKWFANASNEIWLNLSHDLKMKSFDRNWFSIGFGNKITNRANIQLNYLYQWI